MTELRRKPEVDYYKVLQVDPEAEAEVIEAAYRALSKKYHPDINRASDAMDRMSQINSAYNTLSDPSKRRDYNYLRGSHSKNTVAVPRPASSTGSSYTAASPVRRPTQASGAAGSSFNPSASTSASNSGATRPKAENTTGTGNGSDTFNAKTGNGKTGSFRPQGSPAARPGERAKTPPRPAPARSGPTFYGNQARPRSKAGLWVLGLFGLVLLLVVGVIVAELVLGNPLKTSFFKQNPITPVSATTRTPASPVPITTTQPPLPTSREGISTFLNNTDLYAGRVGDVGLTAPDVLQLRIKLASSGTVLNSDTAAANRPSDDLDSLRQSEATTNNLLYTLFGRFGELNRINLVLTDSKDKPLYRADVGRGEAYTFYQWHSGLQTSDTAEVIKAARQDRLALHYGVALDETVRSKLQAPTEASLQAELQSIGLSAFSVTPGPPVTVNYFQSRSQAETAVDFARIIYTLYTRFPTLDRLQITVSTSPDRPLKAIDRQLFSTIGLESWAQAAYGGVSAGGDRQAQTLIASLPNNAADLKTLSVSGQAKFRTPVQVGTWAVVSENVERFDSLSLEGLKIPAGQGRQFLVVRVALRNTSDGRQWLQPGERMSLLDTARGATAYTADPNATLLYVLKTPPATDPPPGPIEAGKQGAVFVVFNVPATTNPNTLKLQFIDADKRALLDLA